MIEFDPSSGFSITDLAEVDRHAYYQDIDEIGPYELIRQLGSGGMSRVFHGRHKRSGQEVAVKILRPEMLARRHVVHRFQTEFRAARKLFHPNLVRALDFGTDQGLAYLVLEYVAGKSMFDLLREKLRLDEDLAVRLIRQAAEGLRAAHQMNLVHRDIKPANILIANNGEAKLSDLGLAKDLLAEESITRSGASLGTLHYMAPEQFMNARTADARADLYSMGVTLYHVLTGRLPFTGGQLTMLQKKMENQFVPPRDLVAGLSTGINRLIMRTLRSDASERPTTCGEFLEELETAGSKPSSVISTIHRTASDFPTPVSKDERRAEDRFPTSLNSSCAMLMNPNKQAWRGQVVDVSSGGAHLYVDRRFEIGSVLAVDIDDEQLPEPLSFLLRVTWVRPSDDAHHWRVGGKFHRRMPPSELQRLLQRELRTVVLQEN